MAVFQLGYINEHRKFRLVEGKLTSGIGTQTGSTWRCVIPEKSFILSFLVVTNNHYDINGSSYALSSISGRTAKECYMATRFASQPLFITKSIEDSDFTPEGRIVDIII